MGRRSDVVLVDEIISFLVERKNEKTVSVNDFCNNLNINSATAKKWLDILSFIRMMCPEFYVEEEEHNSLIKFPNTLILSINTNQMASKNHQGR